MSKISGTSVKKATPKSKRGGAREGSGRPKRMEDVKALRLNTLELTHDMLSAIAKRDGKSMSAVVDELVAKKYFFGRYGDSVAPGGM